ncbi:adenosine receptor A2b-like [Orbicella faveolata]|uniref:adenosine receptor A2b-like n=1 Tax=Orbicella faveolata TaxID=48498 RepID=UPI0009E52F75|nr:adenosine receptor A2b-like [Orbicella faveolata]
MTEGRSQSTGIQELYCRTGDGGIHQKIIFSALNIPLCITAFLGNVLIIVVLQKVSFLHPPSKLLLGCLASTDLCVGLITQPLYVSFLMIPAHSRLCHYLNIASFTVGLLLCGVSLFTLTAISVDRLLALLLRMRYRQMVTLRRVRILVASLWISSVALAMTSFYNVRISTGITGVILLSCVATSIYCYVKIYYALRRHQARLRERVHQGERNGGEIPVNMAQYRKTVCTALCM